MHELLDSGIDSDVSFIINGVSSGIRAHSSIVAVRCKSLRAEVCRFRANTKNGAHGRHPTLEIPVEAVSVHTFRKVLKYVYTGTIPLQATDIYDVCSLSARLGIGSLQSIVFAHLRNEDNVRQITTVLDRALQNADQNRLLVARLTEYFAENCSKVLRSAPFEELSSNLMQHIVKQENLGAAEFEVWQALVNWSCTRTDISPSKRVSMMTVSERKTIATHMKGFCRPGYLRILNFDSETFAKEVEPLDVFPPGEVLLKYRFDAAAGKDAFEHAFPGDRYSFLLRIRQRTTCFESSSHPHPRGVSQTVKVQLPRWVTEMKVVFDPRTALGRYADLKFCTDEERSELVFSVRANTLWSMSANTQYRSDSHPENLTARANIAAARPLGLDPIYIAGNCFWFTFYTPQNVGDLAWGYKFFVSIAR